jgi:hypothetical protein
MNKFLSRKFLLTIWISALSVAAPILFKKAEVSDVVILSVLGILGGVGVAYGFINMKAKEKGEL